MKTKLPSDLSIDGVDGWRNWNFAKVPAPELAACCWWEYARESAFIRNLQRRYGDPAWKQPPADWNNTRAVAKYKEQQYAIASDLDRLRQRGRDTYDARLAEELSRPLKEQCFPRPWLSLSAAERKARIVNPAVTVPAFGRGSYAHADIISENAHHRAMTMPPPDWVTPTKSACWFVDAPSSILDIEAGVETGVFRICWGSYTNAGLAKAVRKWAEANRPPMVPKPKPRGRGHDPMEECRASLQRLGLLRLRSQHTLDETLATLAKLPPEQRKASKFVEPGECNREAQKATDDFHRLIPFLDPAEMPCSWPMKK